MGGWNNRSWRARRSLDSDRRPLWPPLPPPAHGAQHSPVPLWEREFCSYVGNISWQRFCENKQYVFVYNNLEHWDDSGAFENFQNAKARFWANYHGQPSDIPFPDPDMYIDKVDLDHRYNMDPELVVELDKIRLPFDLDSNSGLGNTEADNKCNQNKSGNWDIYLEEKPAQVNAWEDNTRSNLSWAAKHESSNKWGNSNYGWTDAVDNPDWRGSSDNQDYQNNRNNAHGGSNNRYQYPRNYGWADAVDNPDWRGSSDNRYYSNNNRNNFHGGSNNRYQDPSNMSGRKRDGGGQFQHRSNKQRSQAEGNQRSSRHDDRRRNSQWRPVQNKNCQNGQEGRQGGRP